MERTYGPRWTVQDTTTARHFLPSATGGGTLRVRTINPVDNYVKSKRDNGFVGVDVMSVQLRWTDCANEYKVAVAAHVRALKRDTWHELTVSPAHIAIEQDHAHVILAIDLKPPSHLRTTRGDDVWCDLRKLRKACDRRFVVRLSLRLRPASSPDKVDVTFVSLPFTVSRSHSSDVAAVVQPPAVIPADRSVSRVALHSRRRSPPQLEIQPVPSSAHAVADVYHSIAGNRRRDSLAGASKPHDGAILRRAITERAITSAATTVDATTPRDANDKRKAVDDGGSNTSTHTSFTTLAISHATKALNRQAAKTTHGTTNKPRADKSVAPLLLSSTTVTAPQVVPSHKRKALHLPEVQNERARSRQYSGDNTQIRPLKKRRQSSKPLCEEVPEHTAVVTATDTAVPPTPTSATPIAPIAPTTTIAAGAHQLTQFDDKPACANVGASRDNAADGVHQDTPSTCPDLDRERELLRAERLRLDVRAEEIERVRAEVACWEDEMKAKITYWRDELLRDRAAVDDLARSNNVQRDMLLQQQCAANAERETLDADRTELHRAREQIVIQTTELSSARADLDRKLQALAMERAHQDEVLLVLAKQRRELTIERKSLDYERDAFNREREQLQRAANGNNSNGNRECGHDCARMRQLQDDYDALRRDREQVFDVAGERARVIDELQVALDTVLDRLGDTGKRERADITAMRSRHALQWDKLNVDHGNSDIAYQQWLSKRAIQGSSIYQQTRDDAGAGTDAAACNGVGTTTTAATEGADATEAKKDLAVLGAIWIARHPCKVLGVPLDEAFIRGHDSQRRLDEAWRAATLDAKTRYVNDPVARETELRLISLSRTWMKQEVVPYLAAIWHAIGAENADDEAGFISDLIFERTTRILRSGATIEPEVDTGASPVTPLARLELLAAKAWCIVAKSAINTICLLLCACYAVGLADLFVTGVQVLVAVISRAFPTYILSGSTAALQVIGIALWIAIMCYSLVQSWTNTTRPRQAIMVLVRAQPTP